MAGLVARRFRKQKLIPRPPTSGPAGNRLEDIGKTLNREGESHETQNCTSAGIFLLCGATAFAQTLPKGRDFTRLFVRPREPPEQQCHSDVSLNGGGGAIAYYFTKVHRY